MNVLDILTQTTKEGASDLFIVAGRRSPTRKTARFFRPMRNG